MSSRKEWNCFISWGPTSLLAQGKGLGEEAVFPGVSDINPKSPFDDVYLIPFRFGREPNRILAGFVPNVTKIGPKASPAGHAFPSSFA